MVRLAFSLLLVMVPAGWAQDIVSAQSGTVHYFEGKVFLDGDEIESKPGKFPQIKENSILKTERGRAEVLLTPGVFLRVGEDTSVKMLSSRLADTRLHLLAGAAVLEVADFSLLDVPKTAPLTITLDDASFTISKKGLYYFSAEPAQVKVYDGQLDATAGGQTVTAKEGRVLSLDGTLALAKFDAKTGDPLLRWARRRAESMSLASISAAKTALDWGGGWSASSWLWNPYFGMFTFIPARGIYTSPFGFRFWSPFTVVRIYQPQPVFAGNPMPGWDSSIGYRTMPRASGGYSGTAAAAPPSVSAPSTSSAGANSAPVSRGDAGGGGSRSQ